VNLDLWAVQFPIIIFNLHQNPSLNTQEIKLPSPKSNSKSILHWRRHSRRSYLSNPAFPCRWTLPPRKLCSSHVPRFDFHLWLNQKWSWSISFPFNCHCGSVLEPNISMFEDWFLLLDCYWKLRLVLPCNGHSCCSIYHSKLRKYLMEILERWLHIWYSKFLEFPFRILVKTSK
jgi:hypothetical protein